MNTPETLVEHGGAVLVPSPIGWGSPTGVRATPFANASSYQQVLTGPYMPAVLVHWYSLPQTIS